MKRLLVHMCCGPCSIYPLKKVLDGRMEVCGFFYNPNIHPRSEFMKRLEAVKTLARLLSLKVLYREEYEPMGFIRGVREHSGERFPKYGVRCAYCYAERLEATARAARDEGFDAFTSSLLYSRYQNHALIRELGSGLAEKYGVEFLYEDFRTGWQDGIDESRSIGIYRQKYCGCIYSRIERYSNKRKINQAAQAGP